MIDGDEDRRGRGEARIALHFNYMPGARNEKARLFCFGPNSFLRLLTHTWSPPPPPLPRSVRSSVGKVAAVTRVTHNAQNNKGEKRSRKKPENLENSFLSFSRLRSVSLTVGEGLAKECPQVVPGKAAVGTVPLEALEPIDDLILVEIGLHTGIV